VFDPKSQGFGLKFPGSWLDAEIAGLNSTPQQKIRNFPVSLSTVSKVTQKTLLGSFPTDVYFLLLKGTVG